MFAERIGEIFQLKKASSSNLWLTTQKNTCWNFREFKKIMVIFNFLDPCKVVQADVCIWKTYINECSNLICRIQKWRRQKIKTLNQREMHLVKNVAINFNDSTQWCDVCPDVPCFTCKKNLNKNVINFPGIWIIIVSN